MASLLYAGLCVLEGLAVLFALLYSPVLWEDGFARRMLPGNGMPQCNRQFPGILLSDLTNEEEAYFNTP
jgi:hypothetical protein